MRLSPHVQELYVGVPMPGMEGLMGVEAVAVPAVNAGGACLGAVSNHKVPLFIQLEGLHKVGLPHTACVDVLDLYEALGILFPPDFTNRQSLEAQSLSK